MERTDQARRDASNKAVLNGSVLSNTVKHDGLGVSVLGSRSHEQEENSCGKTRRSGKADTGETHDTTKSKTKKCS